jgi:hypothetical protein
LLKVATANYIRHDIGDLSELTPSDSFTDYRGQMIADFSASMLDKMGIDLAYIRREIAKDQFMETVSRSVGPMKNLYTRIEFSPDVHRELRERWYELRRGNRLVVTGILSGFVLGAVGLVFGLLKIDTATKGYYSKRLFLGVPVLIVTAFAILGVSIVAALAFLGMIVGHKL